MSDKDIWEAYADRRRENKHKLTDMYMHVLREQRDYNNGPRYWEPDRYERGGSLNPASELSAQEKNLIAYNWMAQSNFAAPGVAVQIKDFLDVAGCDWGVVNKFVESNERKSFQGILQDMSSPDGGGMKSSLVSILLQDLKIPMESVEGLYYNLFNLPFAESTVSVGKGELIIALLTDATKGSIGDIEVAGQPVTQEIDEEGAHKPGKGLATGNLQIEVKVGKARVVSARNNKFMGPNQGLEKMFAARKDPQGNIISTPHVEPTSSGNLKQIPIDKNDFDRAAGDSTVYDTSVGVNLTNDEFVDHLFSPENEDTAQPGTFFDPKGTLATAMRRRLENKDPNAGPAGVNHNLREQMISAAIVYSYANPSKENAHGFDYLLAILSSGQKERENIWDDEKHGPAGENLQRRDYPEDAVTSTGKPHKYAGKSVAVYPAQMTEGDKDVGIAIPCKDEKGFEAIADAIDSGKLIVTRVNATSGRLDGEGMYMYYAGSDTNVGHEDAAGLDMFGNRDD